MTAVTATPNDDESWSAASDWDDPLTVAVVYKDTNTKNGCGHVLQWKADRLVDLRTCPICKEPVGMICDGLVAFNDDPTNNVVRFKFGTHVFQLSTGAEPVPSVGSSQITVTKSSQSSSWWGSINSRTDTSRTGYRVLAQERIARSLDLVGLKVLYKGKVLYPIATSKLSKESISVREIPDDEAISQQLLEISHKDWHSGATTSSCTTTVHKSGRNSSNKKISLVVMGTLKARQLDEPQTIVPQSVLFVQRLQQTFFFPLNLMSWLFQLGWLFFRSFFVPFWPASAPTTNESTDGDDYIDRGNQRGEVSNRNRPHDE